MIEFTRKIANWEIFSKSSLLAVVTMLFVCNFCSDFQAEKSQLEAEWDMSGDPCPAVNYTWSIQQTDGVIIQDYVDMYSKYTETHISGCKSTIYPDARLLI